MLSRPINPCQKTFSIESVVIQCLISGSVVIVCIENVSVLNGQNLLNHNHDYSGALGLPNVNINELSPEDL